MPLSVVIDGKVKDFRYVRLQPSWYSFWVGETLVGQVIKTRDKTWTAIASGHKVIMRKADGFGSRHHASEFLLTSVGIYK